MSGYAIYQTIVIGFIFVFCGVGVTNMMGLRPEYSFAIALFFLVLSLMGVVWKNKQIKVNRGSLKKIRNATFEFIDFCIQFNSACDQDKGGDTSPLSIKLTEYKKTLEQQGPFANKEICKSIDEIKNIAINLQRKIGRQARMNMPDDERLNIYEDRHDLISRMGEIRKLVKSNFDRLIEKATP